MYALHAQPLCQHNDASAARAPRPGPTRVPAALGAFLAPAAGLRAGWGWAAASLQAPAPDHSITAAFLLACDQGACTAALRGFHAKAPPAALDQGMCMLWANTRSAHRLLGFW